MIRVDLRLKPDRFYTDKPVTDLDGFTTGGTAGCNRRAHAMA